MSVVGIGTDIVNIQRITKAIKKNNKTFKKKIFTSREINYCEMKKNPYPYFAKRFAAKEALSKALGTGIRKGINFKNIEVINDKYGKPSIKLNGSTANYLIKKIKSKSYYINLSLSDDAPWAQATVIITSKKWKKNY